MVGFPRSCTAKDIADEQGAVECFIVGAALSSTSLGMELNFFSNLKKFAYILKKGTTFVVLSDASKGVDFTQSKVGTVLLSAAIIDDVSGLVMAR